MARVSFTPEARAWYLGLPRSDRNRFDTGLELLAVQGPTLGRPHVDTVKGSRHANMKELRAAGTPLRLLFAFGPDRRAIMLTGGDKSQKGWYRKRIRTADRQFDEHLTTFRRESVCRATRAGKRSDVRAR